MNRQLLCANLSLLFIICACFLASSAQVFGQCTCMGGAAVGGNVPGFTMGAMGVLHKGDLQIAASYSYGFGDTYLRGTDHADSGPVLFYNMHYLNLSAVYGLTDELTLNTGVGIFPRKTQQFEDYAITGSGIAHVIVGGRYLLLRSEENSVEWAIGADGRIPIDRSSDNLPQHLNPSTGAFGASIQTRVVTPLMEGAVKLLCSQTVNFYGVNASKYQYGIASTTTIGALWSFSERVNVIAEFRGYHRMRDRMYDEYMYDTGSTVVSIVPQIGVQLGSWLLSPYIEYPLFRNYWGYQLANDVVLGMNIIWYV